MESPRPAAPVELSGLETIRAIFAGELPPPPIAELMGFRGVEVEAGRAVFEFEPGYSTTTRSARFTEGSR